MDIKYLIILLFLFYILIYIIENNNIINKTYKTYKTNTIKKTVSFADENNKPLQTFIKIVN